MSKLLTDLDPRMRAAVAQLLTRVRDDLNFTIIVVDTLRTPTEQEHFISIGVSWTTRSKHLPQPCCGKSHAIDIVPKHLTVLKNWAPAHPDWTRLGELGESLGFEWGGRWKVRDCPHFQWKPPEELNVPRTAATRRRA